MDNLESNINIPVNVLRRKLDKSMFANTLRQQLFLRSLFRYIKSPEMEPVIYSSKTNTLYDKEKVLKN